ncbi:hypothetical protein CJ030_MR2G007951 [Morella rubra]|uniref:Uncharacterized protein n=1 Tax=Morella rubra TaxID=262757 RepID=A0A6A1WFK2_9ROSI|nr:hypothetical protein CJ030_MR2G007951 [Morella rubra]
MESLSKLNCQHQPVHLSLNHYRPSFPRAVSSVSFQTPPPPHPSWKWWPLNSSSIKASSSSARNQQTPRNPKPRVSQTLNPAVKTACATVAATAALFFLRFHHKPAIAAPTAPPTVESTIESTDMASSPEEKERIIEDQLSLDPNDTEALRSLMEELARNGFEEILQKDPFRVEAYHGLVMVSSEKFEENFLEDVTKRVEEAMEKCNNLGRKSEVRDFKLLIAQIRVVEGDYLEALKLYQQLVKEEPRDFRPYLCQGILYTLLGKKDEADKQFDKFRRLVPKDHPYKEYFDDNMFATKIFAQKVDRERAGSRR